MWNNRPINRKSRDPVVPAFFYIIIVSYIVLTDWTGYPFPVYFWYDKNSTDYNM